MASRSDDAFTRAVGPYLLQRTLGKGQTGLVRLGVHCVTGKTVAVKIINREKLSKAVLLKVEREIAIMKLIHHPHVLGLFDVYENSKQLYLVLEHVSGGELFDYLVRKGKLSEKEARRFFRQIVSAVDFCHKHKVCHRDLKPENLLLDENKNIKVADFGMASLQVGQKMLETSCGSPHYACPEVIRGEQYDGRKADVWSCGVILFALLVGALPFDDDDLRQLLEKVKRGHFQVPSYVPSGVQQLLRGMVEVNPKKRLTLDEVIRHPWFKGNQDLEPHMPIQDVVETYPIDDQSGIDPDVFDSMASLGCFKDKSVLAQALLSADPNEEKIVYFLLLSHKERQPSFEDEAKAPGALEKDPPRKRIDSRSMSTPHLQAQRSRAQSIGSANLDQLPPRSPRLSVTNRPSNYSTSSGDYYTYTSASPGRGRKTSHAGVEQVGQAATLQPGLSPPTTPSAPWRRKLSQTMKHLTVSPRFHRKRYEGGETEASSPVMPKRSWFSNFRSEKEKGEVVVVLRDMSFPDLKSSILQSFTIVNCHYEEISEGSFKIKYEKSARQKGKAVFKKAVKLTLTVMPTQTISDNSIPFDGKTFSATFTQTAGPTRRFRRVCEKLQAAIVNPNAINPNAINPMCLETTQSISSDEALAPSPPILLNSTDDTDESPINRHNGRPPPLLTSFDSTDIDSDDGT